MNGKKWGVEKSEWGGGSVGGWVTDRSGALSFRSTKVVLDGAQDSMARGNALDSMARSAISSQTARRRRAARLHQQAISAGAAATRGYPGGGGAALCVRRAREHALHISDAACQPTGECFYLSRSADRCYHCPGTPFDAYRIHCPRLRSCSSMTKRHLSASPGDLSSAPLVAIAVLPGTFTRPTHRSREHPRQRY